MLVDEEGEKGGGGGEVAADQAAGEVGEEGGRVPRRG